MFSSVYVVLYVRSCWYHVTSWCMNAFVNKTYMLASYTNTTCQVHYYLLFMNKNTLKNNKHYAVLFMTSFSGFVLQISPPSQQTTCGLSITNFVVRIFLFAFGFISILVVFLTFIVCCHLLNNHSNEQYWIFFMTRVTYVFTYDPFVMYFH